MTVWAAFLMSSVAAIWVGMASGVAYAVARARRAYVSAGERT
jgi:hypothetical protein